MNSRVNILFFLFSVLVAAGCSKEDRDLVPNQHRSFETFFSGKDYVIQDGVYKFVVNAERDGYETEPVAERGDSVFFDYAQYLFTSTKGGLIATNIYELVEADTILNTYDWSFEQERIKLGSTPLLKGIERGLPGCHRGDSVVLLLSADVAYGQEAVGPVAPYSAVMVSLNVLTIK